MSASTCTSPRTLASSRAVVGRLTDDHGAVRHAGVGGPLEHAADDLALEARDVELALAGDDELGAVERGVEPRGLRDDVEAGLEPRAERGEPAGETTRGAAAFDLGDVDARSAAGRRRRAARAGG